MGKAEDLTGQKFNHLTVKFRGENDRSRESRWWCECDCGNPELVLVRKSSLKNGHTKSCGHLQKEAARELNKKYNTYVDKGDYYIGYTEEGEEFFIDKEDYDKIKDYYWRVDKNGYITSKSEDDHIILIHRIFMDMVDSKLDIDHIHGKETRNDNRKSNLRIASRSQNSMNVGIRKTNTSGVTGVTWDKKRNKWRASIRYNNKNINLGRFNPDEFDKAVDARKKAEEKYFGEFSYDNSQAI